VADRFHADKEGEEGAGARNSDPTCHSGMETREAYMRLQRSPIHLGNAVLHLPNRKACGQIDRTAAHSMKFRK
jgi:hypothetical protein